MDLNDVRIFWTVASFLVFLGIVVWAYSRDARRGFDEASRIPFLDDSPASNRSAQNVGSSQ